MSVCDKHGAALHPDEYAPAAADEHAPGPLATRDDYGPILRAVLRDHDELGWAETERLVGVLMDVFDAVGTWDS